MEIDETINKWFQETADKINTAVTNNEPVYDLTSGVLPLVHNYCNSVLLLLNHNKKLPAMALLRVLGELVVRLMWCLCKDNPQQETVDIRIQRWLKESYYQRERHLKKIQLLFPDWENFREELEYVKNEKEKILYEFPGGAKGKRGTFYRSLEELPPINNGLRKLCLLLYDKFHMAIHLDMLVLSNLVRQNGNVRQFLGDFDNVDIEELKIHCMHCAFHIISCIRIIYDLDYENVKAEYLDIKKRFKPEKE